MAPPDPDPMLRKLVREIGADADRYLHGADHPWYLVVLSRQGLWIMLQYRFSRWLRYEMHVPVLRPVLRAMSAVWRKLLELTTCCEFPNSAEIGEGLYMPHAFGIVVHADAKIGRYCNLGQQVTIGIGKRGAIWGAPRLGDRVFVGPGAKILGPVTIGDDAVIGANAVVTKDIPNRAVALGVPARIVGYDGSDCLIGYPRELQQS